VLFLSPHRAAEDLADLADACGEDRPAALCRELTKLHEEVRRGTLGTLRDGAAGGLRGEVTLVLAARRSRRRPRSMTRARCRGRALVAAGLSTRDAVAVSRPSAGCVDGRSTPR
jgi:16S rRNA (cytidine1402-2'-O)-methyltransferase